MTLRIKIFLTAFMVSLPFWWGANLLGKNLNDFFFWKEISQNPQIFTAQIALEKGLKNLKPIRIKSAEQLNINAKSVISVFLSNDGVEKTLFEKNAGQKFPIASLTKLMTAFVVLENYDINKEIQVSEAAVKQEEDFGKLTAGRIFPTKYLLYPLLMESSNDAAFALANDYDGMTEKKFIRLMNETSQKMNLQNTFFANSSGLDPEKPKTKINYSTATDLTKFTKELLKKPLIWQILKTENYSLYGPELVNTDELLGEVSRITGGKTGYTQEAGGCMILVQRAPKNIGYLINIILGTNDTTDRFEEMRKLVKWTESAYKW